MDRREENIAVFQDTMIWIQENGELEKKVKESKKNTIFYGAEEAIEIEQKENIENTQIEVSKMRTLEAACKEREQDEKAVITVLNFASATRPGGGVETGSSAQEEALCRCSTLYPCLKQKNLWDAFYGFHRERHDVRYTDACIYTPNVMVIKTDTNVPKRLPMNAWTEVGVITCAAPNLRKKPYNAMNPGHGTAITVSQKELLEIHKNRGRKILSVAAANKTDVLILGAFGCGAFQNDPNVVARAYREILPEFAGYFKKVHFAVYCSPKDMTNYEVFQRVLGNIRL